MSRIYDLWGKLVGAVLRKEKDRKLAYYDSFSTRCSSDLGSPFSLDLGLRDAASTGGDVENQKASDPPPDKGKQTAPPSSEEEPPTSQKESSEDQDKDKRKKSSDQGVIKMLQGMKATLLLLNNLEHDNEEKTLEDSVAAIALKGRSNTKSRKLYSNRSAQPGGAATLNDAVKYGVFMEKAIMEEDEADDLDEGGDEEDNVSGQVTRSVEEEENVSTNSESLQKRNDGRKKAKKNESNRSANAQRQQAKPKRPSVSMASAAQIKMMKALVNDSTKSGDDKSEGQEAVPEDGGDVGAADIEDEQSLQLEEVEGLGGIIDPLEGLMDPLGLSGQGLENWNAVKRLVVETSGYGSVIHDWQKGELLGCGTFGSVYAGIADRGFFFAVKEVSLHDERVEGKQCIIQLEQEIALLRQFEHDNIVRYYGTQKDATHLYIFLELVTQGSLLRLYEKYDLRVPQVSGYTRQILHGLKYLHDRNVIHRDIKCANILVHTNGLVKLADFGLAKMTAKLNDVKSCKGTAFWMAPEVVRSKGYGLAADIWSLGCTVLEMLTRSIPFSGLEQMAAIYKIGQGERPSVPDTLSRNAQDFILQCLQVDPSLRPTAAQLLDHPFVKRPLPSSSGVASAHSFGWQF